MRLWGLWIAASACGGLLSSIAGCADPSHQTAWLTLGLWFALPQWLVLRSQMRRALQWLFVAARAGGAGTAGGGGCVLVCAPLCVFPFWLLLAGLRRLPGAQ